MVFFFLRFFFGDLPGPNHPNPTGQNCPGPTEVKGCPTRWSRKEAEEGEHMVFFSNPKSPPCLEIRGKGWCFFSFFSGTVFCFFDSRSWPVFVFLYLCSLFFVFWFLVRENNPIPRVSEKNTNEKTTNFPPAPGVFFFRFFPSLKQTCAPSNLSPKCSTGA